MNIRSEVELENTIIQLAASEMVSKFIPEEDLSESDAYIVFRIQLLKGNFKIGFLFENKQILISIFRFSPEKGSSVYTMFGGGDYIIPKGTPNVFKMQDNYHQPLH